MSLLIKFVVPTFGILRIPLFSDKTSLDHELSIVLSFQMVDSCRTLVSLDFSRNE